VYSNGFVFDSQFWYCSLLISIHFNLIT
jgi:hypothetical protein